MSERERESENPFSRRLLNHSLEAPLAYCVDFGVRFFKTVSPFSSSSLSHPLARVICASRLREALNCGCSVADGIDSNLSLLFLSWSPVVKVFLNCAFPQNNSATSALSPRVSSVCFLAKRHPGTCAPGTDGTQNDEGCQQRHGRDMHTHKSSLACTLSPP